MLATHHERIFLHKNTKTQHIYLPSLLLSFPPPFPVYIMFAQAQGAPTQLDMHYGNMGKCCHTTNTPILL